MVAMADPPRPTVRRRRLGRELRRIRDDAGLTLEAAARRLDRTASSLSKIERGVQGLRHGELLFMLDTYGVTDDILRQALITLRRDANKKGWWHQYRDTLSPALLDLIGLESDARSIRIFDTLRIPGLLQTEEYARATFRGGISPPSVDELEAQVSARLTRQEILARSARPRLWAIISRAALHQRVGGPETMRGQLQRLIETAALSNVMLQVLPDATEATACLDGPFMILEVGDRGELPVAFVECLTRGWYLEDEDDLRRYGLAFDQLGAAAFSPADSLALIERVMSEL
jgi:transcriptional regulator with XRE-family HTH domain